MTSTGIAECDALKFTAHNDLAGEPAYSQRNGGEGYGPRRVMEVVFCHRAAGSLSGDTRREGREKAARSAACEDSF